MKNKLIKKKIREMKKNKNLFRTLIFLIKLNLFLIPLYLILMTGLQWIFLKQLTADLSLSLLIATGIPAGLSGSLITVPVNNGNFAAGIDWDCTGWKSMFALFALIFATDFSLRKKLFGLVFIPLTYMVNLIRIWFMFYYVSSFGLAHYDLIHATVWSWGLILTILCFWVIWMKKFPDK